MMAAANDKGGGGGGGGPANPAATAGEPAQRPPVKETGLTPSQLPQPQQQLPPVQRKQTAPRAQPPRSSAPANGSGTPTLPPVGPGGNGAALTATKQQYFARRIWVYRNGDPHFSGKRVLVNSKRYRNFEQFLGSLTSDVGLRTGAVRKIFTTKGVRVDSITNLTEGSHYVAVGNEPFRLIAYPEHVDPATATAAAPRGRADARDGGEEDPGAHQRVAVSRRRSMTGSRARSSGPPGTETKPGTPESEKPIFHPDSKGYRVAVFRNGDLITPPLRIVLGYRNCLMFDQLMNEMTSAVRPKEGRVRRLFDAESYRPIRSLHDLHDGQNLIASGTNAPAQQLAYARIDFSQPTDIRRATQMAQDRGKVITVYPNGDPMHTGVKLTVTSYRFRDMDRLLAYLAGEIPMYTGKATHLCQLDGTRVPDLASLVGNGSYVMVAGTDPFRHVLYNADGYKRPSAPVATTQQSMSRANEVLERSKKLLEEKMQQQKPPAAAGAPPAAATDTANDPNARRKPNARPTASLTIGNITVTASGDGAGGVNAKIAIEDGSHPPPPPGALSPIPEAAGIARAASPAPQAFETAAGGKDLSLKRKPESASEQGAPPPADPLRCPESRQTAV
ncbi:hypothetical protein H9P43_005595 [Blastocladiella emersonii ATCC 22665]|nr:hypothetical protein H9P43_005595 [Blastocladiella emersonii ATCC 22665]